MRDREKAVVNDRESGDELKEIMKLLTKREITDVLQGTYKIGLQTQLQRDRGRVG